MQPTYYVQHPDGSYSPADPQPPAPVQPAPAADTVFYFGYSDEVAAIEAAKRLGMLGKPLNEAGAQGLAYAFLKLRKPDSERDAALNDIMTQARDLMAGAEEDESGYVIDPIAYEHLAAALKFYDAAISAQQGDAQPLPGDKP